MFRDLLDLVFPELCSGCRTPLSRQEQAICGSCLSQLELTEFEQRPTQNDVFFRFAGKTNIAGAAGLYFFDKKGILQVIMHEFKYRNNIKSGALLGRIFASKLSDSGFFSGNETLIPVPLHPKKLKERGYNQSEIFAEAIAERCGIEIKPEWLIRTFYTQSQTGKDKNQRWENVKDAFEYKGPKDSTIILCDDIITTGSTLEACASCLQKSGIDSVKILTLGVARS